MMKEGELVKYIGNGFLGYDPKKPEMIFLQKAGLEVLVEYKGEKVLVRRFEIEKLR